VFMQRPYLTLFICDSRLSVLADCSMQAGYEDLNATNFRDAHEQNAVDGAAGFGDTSGNREGGSFERNQRQGMRCPPSSSSGSTTVVGSAEDVARPLAPENQHPNHLSNDRWNDPRLRMSGNSMRNMQPIQQQQQMQEMEFQAAIAQQHKSAMQHAQMPMVSPTNLQSEDASPRMSPDRLSLSKQHHHPNQPPPNFIQTPPIHAMQPHFSNMEGSFHIPASHQSSTSPSPSSSSSIPASPYRQSGLKQERGYPPEDQDLIELLHVSPTTLIRQPHAHTLTTHTHTHTVRLLVMVRGGVTRVLESSAPRGLTGR
jgi:hypothetical protein